MTKNDKEIIRIRKKLLRTDFLFMIFGNLILTDIISSWAHLKRKLIEE